MDTCHGCGEPYNKCMCEELDAEMNEGKYQDEDSDDTYCEMCKSFNGHDIGCPEGLHG